MPIPESAPPPRSLPTHAVRPVKAMGLVFANPLGLAAGVDRTGAQLAAAGTRAFGHVEIGTLTLESAYAGPPLATCAVRIGLNIASADPGLDARTIEDYVAMLRRVHCRADYVVANLSAPALGRDGDTPGVAELVKRLAAMREVLAAISGRRVPLLVKAAAGARGAPFPAAILAARASGLDGVVLVTDDLERLRAAAAFLGGLAVVSVGGVATAADVRARLSAGAALVQIHRAFASGGPARVRRILRGLAPPPPAAR